MDSAGFDATGCCWLIHKPLRGLFLEVRMFQEYPKVIYRGEEYVVVFSSQEEKEKAAEGFGVSQEKAQEPAKRKPGRPKKVEQ